MGTARLGWSAALTLSLLLLALPAVAVEGGADAKELYGEATAAFGLGHYAAAAEKYEAAFSLRPDPALLYNAAQSFRLAGNKPRALELYRNCLRLYPSFRNAEDARRQVTNLKAEIEQEQSARAATVPPPPSVAVTPSPAAVVPPPTGALPPPVPAASSPPPVLLAAPAVTAPAPAAEADRPVTSKAWFWAAIGAAVVGGTVAVLLATRGTSYPEASFGTVNGN